MATESKGWLAETIKESKRYLELRDPVRTLDLEGRLAAAEAKLERVREYCRQHKASKELDGLQDILEGDSK